MIHSSLQSEEDAIQKKLSVQLCGGTNAAERPSYMLIRSMLIGPNGLPLIRLSLCSASIAKVLWSSFWPAVWSDCMVVFDCSDLQQLQLSTCSVMALLMPNSYIECSCIKCSYIKRSSTKLSGCHPEDGQHIAVPLLMSLAVLLHLPKPSSPQNLGSRCFRRDGSLDGVSVFISSLEAPAAARWPMKSCLWKRAISKRIALIDGLCFGALWVVIAAMLLRPFGSTCNEITFNVYRTNIRVMF